MKTKLITTLLGLFGLLVFGAGIHRIYLGQYFLGLMIFIFNLLFFWTFIPAIVVFFDLIYLASMTDEEFNLQFNKIK